MDLEQQQQQQLEQQQEQQQQQQLEQQQEQQQQQQLEQQQQQQQELEKLKQLLPYIKPLFAPFYAQYLIFERPTLTPAQSTIVDAMFVATSLMPELPLYDEIFQRWAKLMITSILTNDLSGLPKVHEMVMQGTMYYNLPGPCIKFWEQFFAENATPDYAAHLKAIPFSMIHIRDAQLAALRKEQDITSLSPFTRYQLKHPGNTNATYNPENPGAFKEHLRDDTTLKPDDRRQILDDLQKIIERANTSGHDDKKVANMRQIMHGIEVTRYRLVAIPNGIRMVTLNSYVAIDKTIRIDAHLCPAINVMRDGIVSCARHIAQLSGVDINARNKLFHSYFQAILAYFTYTPYADQYADATHEFQANPTYGKLKDVFAPFMSVLRIEDNSESCSVILTEYGLVQGTIQTQTQTLPFSILADLFGKKFDNYECSLLKKMKDNFRDGLNMLITHFQSFPEYQKTLNAQIGYVPGSPAASSAAGPASPVQTPPAAGLQPSPVSPQGQIQSPQSSPASQSSTPSTPLTHYMTQQAAAEPGTPRVPYNPNSFGASLQSGYPPSFGGNPSSFGQPQYQPPPSSFGQPQYQPPQSFGASLQSGYPPSFGQPHPSSFGQPHPSSFGAQPGYQPQAGYQQSFEQVDMGAGSKKTRTKRSVHKHKRSVHKHKRSAHKHKRSVHKHKRSSRKHK